nr:LpqB family beta-propeller domain-containing protein [uncultured Actinoplanes sp.]
MRRRLLLLATAIVLLAGGCGIPDDGDVTVVGNGPSTGISVGDDGRAPTQFTRESTNDPLQLVNYYLEAAAGDPDSALERAKAFMSPELADGFQAGKGSDVKVVREAASPLYNADRTAITLIVQQVGTLNSNGILTPPADPSPATTRYTLEVDRIPNKDGLFILQAPPMLMISDLALRRLYEPRTIYWWNMEYTGLVPDLRYMPLTVPPAQQPTTVLSWLANGPADWLRDVVHVLPQGTQAAENVPAIRDGTLQISLNAPAVQPGDTKEIDRLRRQLQWSLRPLEPRTLELTIGRQDPQKFTDAEYQTSNEAYRLADIPERFVIYNDVIRRLKDTPHDTDPIPVLKPEANRNITAAAMNASRTHAYAAVVTGSGKSQRLRVAAAPLGETADLKEVGGLSGPLGRPVWASTPDGDPRRALGLITVNGQVYSFRANGTGTQRVDWQSDPGPISSISVAPDGRRVAVVARGKLYRTVLNYSGDSFALSTPEQLLPPTLTGVAAVAWSSETRLAVAGVLADGRYSVSDVTVDGALSVPGLPDVGTEPVTYLTAYPANPVTRASNLSAESYEAGNRAWDVQSAPVPINVDALAGPPASPRPGAGPTAPFFLG